MILDYSLTTGEQRTEYVRQLLKKIPPEELNNNTLTYLADYILFTSDKHQTKKERQQPHPILTKNRETTINKRQVSYEGLVDSLETGEDGLFNLIREDKGQILDPKDPITQKDIDTIPGIKECLDLIAATQKTLKNTHGKRRWHLKKIIIETWQQAYYLKANAGQVGHIKAASQIKSIAAIDIPEEVYFDEQGIPKSNMPLSLLNMNHIAFLLQYYQKLKEESWEDLQGDMRWHLIDLENLASDALENKYPLLWDVLIWKVDGLSNAQIQEQVERIYGEVHTEQYYSSLWTKRIPKLIMEEAQRQYLEWYYTNVEYGHWKQCTKCGRVKLAHPLFYATNTSKDGWYSQCKDCKNGKTPKEIIEKYRASKENCK